MSKIGYARVSSGSQNLDRQQDAFEALALDRVFSDKASGRDTARPGLQEMLGYIRAGDTLYVESISRLARSVRDLLSIVEQLESKQIAFVSLKESIDTSSPAGRFVLTIFAAMSQMERETIRVRQREGIESARLRGRVLGRPAATYPPTWNEVYVEWQAGKLTAGAAMRRLGLRHTTFYKLARQAAERVAS
ncbi:MAG: recombinase family protein [Spirochaetia bacterium]|jgi:DNA invertase Pin-like site-specific DNA recombinase